MTSIAPPSRPAPDRGADRLPPLMAGDHLDRATFHARYAAMPEEVRAELVGGIVYMPVSRLPHAGVHAKVIAWLDAYESATPGTESLDNATIGYN